MNGHHIWGSGMQYHSGNVMNCHATAPGSIPGRDGVFTELHVLRKGQEMGVPSLNDLAVDGTLNTNKQTNLSHENVYNHLTCQMLYN